MRGQGAAPALIRMTYAWWTKGGPLSAQATYARPKTGVPVYVSCILHQSQISAPCNFGVITVITITVFYVRFYTPGHNLAIEAAFLFGLVLAA